jgi:hypothetical protein
VEAPWGSRGDAGDIPEVVLPPGVYREHLVLDRPVCLTARDGLGSVVVVVESGIALTVSADVVLRGVVVRSGDPELPTVVIDAGSPVFERCEIRGARVETVGKAAPTFRECVIRGTELAGLHATGRSRPRLEDCTLADVQGHALAAADEATPQVARTVIIDPTGAGIRLIGGARADFVDCSVLGSGGPGLLVEQEAGVRLRSCRIVDAASDGIRVDGSSPLRDRRLPFDAPTPLDDVMTGLYGPAQTVQGVTLVDCDVSGAAAEGVVAAGGEIRLENSRISRSGGTGVLASGSARIEFEDSAVTRSVAMGVMVRGSARLQGLRMKVTECGGYGMVAAEEASVELGWSECTDTALAAVMLAGHASLRARQTRFGQAVGHGLWVRGHAIVQLGACEVRACGQDGVRVDGAGEATLRDCEISGSRNGVVLLSPHHPVLDRCTISDVERVGVTVGPGGIPLLRFCVVSGAGSHGVFLDHHSAAQIDACRIEDVGGNGMVVWTGAEPRVTATAILRVGQHGLSVQDGGLGIFEGCDIGGGPSHSAVHRRPGAEPVLLNCRLHEHGEPPAAGTGSALVTVADRRREPAEVAPALALALPVSSARALVVDSQSTDPCPPGQGSGRD